MGRENLIHSLQNAALFRHPVRNIKVIETHISWVVLTGDYAYKIKKPINLGFVDFSTLEKRQFFCQAEFRLNKVWAPNLYLAVLPISGTADHPEINGQGPPIEYVILMHQFDQNCLLSQLIEQDFLTPTLIQDIAHQVADFHHLTKPTAQESPYGDPLHIWRPILDNFSSCRSLITDPEWLTKLRNIEHWSTQAFNTLQSIFEERKKMGFIKPCHGDLHLGNMFYQDNRITIFDCIEFNEDFRNIDVINDIAFLTMDLKIKKHIPDTFRFLNNYLQVTGDFLSLRLLRFYEVYRAMVRVKVALLLEQQTFENHDLYKPYLELALAIATPASVNLVITHGVPGSGKSTVVEKIAPLVGAIHIRTDIERKRLFKTDTRYNAADLYTEKNIDATYQHIATITEMLLHAGFSVIVDGTFLKSKHRALFQKIAKTLHISFGILNCVVDPSALPARLINRKLSKQNVSDADISIVKQLINTADPLTPEELTITITLSTEKPIDIARLARSNIFR